MSIIGTIRRKFTWLLLGLIALAILAFLLMDGTAGQGQTLTGNQKMGTVDGKKIKAMDMQAEMIELKRKYPNANDEQLQNTAWQNMIEKQIFAPRYQSLGLAVSNEELTDLIKGEEPHPYARQMLSFLFPDGEYDPAAVDEFFKTDENGKLAAESVVDAITDVRMSEKYSSLLKNGVNVPTWMAEDEFIKQYKTVDFDYVLLPYSLVDDSEIVINDADLRAYAEKHRGQFESKDGYKLQYLNFNQTPTAADSTAQKSAMQSLKSQFEKDENPEQFAQRHTTAQLDRRTMAIDPNIEWQTQKTLRTEEARTNEIINANVGDVIGPFSYQGYMYVTKVLDKKTVADSASVRHILIEGNPTDPAAYLYAQNLADSLATELRNDKSKFNEFVKQYSSDEASVPNNGVYENFPQGQMVPEFNTAAFNNEIGSIEVVETMFGFHILEPLNRKGSSKAVKLATFVQGVRASQETIDAAYNKAKKFEKESQTEEKFIENAKEFGGVQTTELISPDATQIAGIGQNYELIRWANSASPGSVKFFSGLNGGNIVARLVSRSKAGDIDINEHKTRLTNEVKKEKKAEVLRKQIAEKGGASQPLGTIANQLGRSIQTATEAKFGSSGSSIGYEPNLVSKLFFNKEGQVNEPINGERGVYIVDIKKFGELPPESNFDQYKTNYLNSMNQNTSMNALVQQLKEEGVIKDERNKIR